MFLEGVCDRFTTSCLRSVVASQLLRRNYSLLRNVLFFSRKVLISPFGVSPRRKKVSKRRFSVKLEFSMLYAAASDYFAHVDCAPFELFVLDTAASTVCKSVEDRNKNLARIPNMFLEDAPVRRLWEEELG